MSQRRGSYRRSRYSATPIDNTQSESTELVSKGDNDSSEIRGETITKSIQQLDGILKELRANSDLPIRDLPPNIQEKYRQAVAYVTMLFDTDHYPSLAKVVKKRFGNIENPKPGTLGAYFGGCLIQSNIKGVAPGCTPVCVNSLPPSPDQAQRMGWSPCEQNVIMATMVNGTYSISKLNDIQNRQDAVIYINQPVFNGFSQEEKRRLQQLGVREASILTYQNGQYQQLLSTTPLAEIQTRVIQTPAGTVVDVNRTTVDNTNPWIGTPTANDPGISSKNTILIVLLVLALVVILFLLWRK